MPLARSTAGPTHDPARYALLMDGGALLKAWAAEQGLDRSMALAQWRLAQPGGLLIGCGPVSYWSPSPSGHWPPQDNEGWDDAYLIHTPDGDLHTFDGFSWIDYSNLDAAVFMAKDTADKFARSWAKFDGVHVDRCFTEPRMIKASWLNEGRWLFGLMTFFAELRRLLPAGALIQSNGIANGVDWDVLAPWVDGVVLEDHLPREDTAAFIAEIASRYRYAVIGAGYHNELYAQAEAVVRACPGRTYLLSKEPT